jgi:hypothetical protein
LQQSALVVQPPKNSGMQVTQVEPVQRPLQQALPPTPAQEKPSGPQQALAWPPSMPASQTRPAQQAPVDPGAHELPNQPQPPSQAMAGEFRGYWAPLSTQTPEQGAKGSTAPPSG